jgi:hypothetical protein
MKFKKQILTEGLYLVGDGKGGRKATFVTKDRINHWVNQHKAMRNAGLNIPAPEFHDPKAVPSEQPVGSKSNYGFWESLEQDQTEDGLVAMNGVLDAPHEEDAEKIGKTVRETSIYAVPKFVDGHGNEWEDVLTHIAVVTKPIEPGQKNFESVGDATAVSMSHRLPLAMSTVNSLLYNDEDNANPDDLCEMLKEVAGLAVPKGISPEQLPQALLAALQQKQLSEKHREGGTVSKPPKNSELHEVPVAMSTNQTQGTAQNSADPQIETPNETDIQMSHVQKQNDGLIKHVTESKKQELRTRLASLAKRGLVDADQQKDYSAKIDGIVSMSFDDNLDVVTEPVEYQIAALERVQIKMPSNQPMVAMADNDLQGNYVIQPNPTPSSETQMTEDRAKSIVDSLMGSTAAN